MCLLWWSSQSAGTDFHTQVSYQQGWVCHPCDQFDENHLMKTFVFCCYWWWWNIGLHPQMAFPLGINCQDCHHAWICFRGGRKYDSMVSGERFSSKSAQNLSLVPDWVVGRVYLPSSRATHYHVRILHSQRHSGHLDFQKGDHDFPIIVYYAPRVTVRQ